MCAGSLQSLRQRKARIARSLIERNLGFVASETGSADSFLDAGAQALIGLGATGLVAYLRENGASLIETLGQVGSTLIDWSFAITLLP